VGGTRAADVEVGEEEGIGADATRVAAVELVLRAQAIAPQLPLEPISSHHEYLPLDPTSCRQLPIALIRSPLDPH
jgi:hypothetical protein